QFRLTMNFGGQRQRKCQRLPFLGGLKNFFWSMAAACKELLAGIEAEDRAGSYLGDIIVWHAFLVQPAKRRARKVSHLFFKRIETFEDRVVDRNQADGAVSGGIGYFHLEGRVMGLGGGFEIRGVIHHRDNLT